MDWTTKVGGYIVGITHISVLLLGLGIVWQVLFGSAIPFIGGDVINNIAGIIQNMGNQGLVGILTVAVVFWLFRHHKDL